MRRDRVISKLKELGYKFSREAWRVNVYRNPTTMHLIEVRNRDDIDDAWVRSTLRQAGCSTEEIAKFMAQANN